MTDIMKILEERSKEIDKIIEKYIPKKYDFSSLEFTLGKPRYKYSTEAPNKAIADPIWNLLNRGGKRWRPTLYMLVCEALGGSSKENLDFVVILESIHNGTLMIDDIEDSSELRRGKPCIHKIFGDDIAINAGNAMYYLPLLSLMKNNIDDKTKVKAYEIYTQEMINISFGQGMDIAWHKGIANADTVSEAEYLQMVAYKTGTLSRMAAKLGALFAGSDEPTIEKLGLLGESIGVGFQIQDDILNLTAISDKNQFVKDYIGSDITEGKRTLMIIHSLANASESDKTKLISILNEHTTDKEKINEAIEILKKYDSIDYAKQKAKKILEDAWNETSPLLAKGQAKDSLKSLVYFGVDREY
ncbi:polyprenyl synthetase family protein [Candidatus Aenigmatarchaeota archaeon]